MPQTFADSRPAAVPCSSVPTQGGYSGYSWGESKTFPVGTSVELRRWIWRPPGVLTHEDDEGDVLTIRTVGDGKKYGVADYPYPIWFLRMKFTPDKK